MHANHFRAVVLALMLAVMPWPSIALAMAFDDFETLFMSVHRDLERHRFHDALRAAQKLLEVAPHNAAVELAYAQAAAGVGPSEEALGIYEKIVAQGFGASLLRNSAFAALPHSHNWARILRRARSESSPVGKAIIAFEIPDAAVIPEGLAFDPATAQFYITSTYQRKILVRRANGDFGDFVAPQDHGLLQALGVRVDASGRRLLLCSGADDNRLVGFKEPDRGKSGVFVYDLQTARLIQQAWATEQGTHLFNDLVQGPDGALYVTDSRAGDVYRYDLAAGTLSPITEPDTFLYPNGIAIDPSGKYVFVADEVGVSRLDLQTYERSRLGEPDTTSSAAIDGLYFVKGELIGVQGVGGVERIVALQLNEQHSAITRSRVILRGDPRLENATEGVILDDQLYFIANSEQEKFDQNGQLDMERLRKSVVLRVGIPANGDLYSERHAN